MDDLPIEQPPPIGSLPASCGSTSTARATEQPAGNRSANLDGNRAPLRHLDGLRYLDGEFAEI